MRMGFTAFIDVKFKTIERCFKTNLPPEKQVFGEYPDARNPFFLFFFMWQDGGCN